MTKSIRFKAPESGKTLVFLTDQMSLPALTLCALCKNRWQVELFFKLECGHLPSHGHAAARITCGGECGLFDPCQTRERSRE